MAKGKDSEPDAIDRLMAQWKRERPDLDADAMGTVGRVNRVVQVLTPRVEAVMKRHGLNIGEFDVLASLRRSGEPYRLSPTALHSALLVSSGAMTNRLDRLEERGLIERLPDPADRRAIQVALTDAGRELIEEAVTEHVDNLQRLLAPLTRAERDELDRLAKKLLRGREG